MRSVWRGGVRWAQSGDRSGVQQTETRRKSSAEKFNEPSHMSSCRSLSLSPTPFVSLFLFAACCVSAPRLRPAVEWVRRGEGEGELDHRPRHGRNETKAQSVTMLMDMEWNGMDTPSRRSGPGQAEALRRWGARNDSRHSSAQGDSPSLPVSLSPDRRP